MPTTLDQEYNDNMNIIYSLLFLIGLVTLDCCVYCIIKKEKNEIINKKYNIDIV